MSEVVEFSKMKERVRVALDEICKKVLEGKKYDLRYQTRWVDTITQDSIDILRELSPNFKYCVSCIILQKRIPQGNLYSETTAFWNPVTDGFCGHLWENSTITCIINAFATSIIA